jgi:hypothetical protein
MRKWKLAGAGFVCAAIGVFAIFDSLDKAGWRKAAARVTALEVSCHMKATEHHIAYKTVSEADIPCEAVDAFKILHSDKSWSSTERFDAMLAVAGADGSTATAQMDLNRIEGRAPQVGDALTVIQNPAQPSKVARADSAGTGLMIAFLLGGLGALLLWLAFGNGGKRKEALVVDAQTEGEDSAKRADAMIAAAMAQTSKPVSKQPAMVVTARPAPMVQAGSRTSFGKKR